MVYENFVYRSFIYEYDWLIMTLEVYEDIDFQSIEFLPLSKWSKTIAYC